MSLSLSSCATPRAPPPTDSFCEIYRQIITQKGDTTINATLNVKRRILANELTYRQQCKGA